MVLKFGHKLFRIHVNLMAKMLKRSICMSFVSWFNNGVMIKSPFFVSNLVEQANILHETQFNSLLLLLLLRLLFVCVLFLFIVQLLKRRKKNNYPPMLNHIFCLPLFYLWLSLIWAILKRSNYIARASSNKMVIFCFTQKWLPKLPCIPVFWETNVNMELITG